MPPQGMKHVNGKAKGMASKVADKAGKALPAEDWKFTPPPEAPVFEPTPEEFEDPLAYIAKIRPIAEKAGICKIRPPNDWQPPFAVDVDKFKFTPRIQRLNELEAKTRVKLNFFDQIAKFWELQGSTLKIPMIDRKALDLYTLHRYVLQLTNDNYEGFVRQKDKAAQEQLWSDIAMKMGYPPKRGHYLLLKHHYDRILRPYDIFLKHPPTENLAKPKREVKAEPKLEPKAETKVEAKSEPKSDDDEEGEEYKQHQIPSRQAIEPPASQKSARRSKRYGTCDPVKDGQDPTSPDSKELRRLLFYGAGPKMAGYNEKQSPKKKNSKKGGHEYDPLAKYVCQTCERGDAEESMLLCDGCDDSYHTFCLVPPLSEIPKGDWRCPKCLAEEVSKPLEAFGFEQAQREYSLQQFCEMADRFKSEYFNMPVHVVPTSLVEKEFWRLVSSIDEDVTVEYGADLHTMDHGSGFPTNSSDTTCEYAKSNWNLNNLPVLEGSVLGHINADISGMKVPWMYVGMCFATFCWHNEDHWSYSINYLHWGEPKTWYGVPGSSAEAFEDTMKQAAPELFQSQPDLLHQLVTIMNPNILMNDGVPVFRCDQHAGEFVVTFPRAYHAGFNQGFNFAEAVNFAPADWLSLGRNCITHYSNLRRFCVFSHDELVCGMASDPKELELGVAAAAYQDMSVMVESEKKLRKSLLEWGVRTAERKNFESMPDDERQCEVCKTTCFLSAVTCDCETANPKGQQRLLACLRHYTDLCSCDPTSHTLWYRYTLDELPLMLRDIKLRAESFDNWVSSVKDALDFNTPKTLDLAGFKALLQEAEDKKFPDSELLQALRVSVQEATKCANVASQLGGRKTRNRTRTSQEPRLKLTVEELQLFVEEIDELPCILRDGAAVKDVLEKVKEFQTKAAALMSKEPNIEVRRGKEVREVLELGLNLDVELTELSPLKDLCLQEEWLDKAVRLQNAAAADLDEVTSLVAACDDLPTPRHPVLTQLLEEFSELESRALNWQTRAKTAIQEASLEKLESLDHEAEEMSVFVPEMNEVEDAVKTAAKWKVQAAELQAVPDGPELELVEALVLRGQACPARPPGLAEWEERIRNARTWREKTFRTFMFRDSPLSLVEALLPRTEVGVDSEPVKKDKDPVKDETAAVLDIQETNTQKRLKDLGDKTYCICKKPFAGVMVKCEICYDWFHARCVPLPEKNDTMAPTMEDRIRAVTSRQVKFLCPVCQRSKRPQFKAVFQLLSNIQKLGVQMVEARVVHSLCQRALNWKEKARKMLSQEDLYAPSPSIGEHTYSALSPSKHMRKSPLVPRQEKPSSVLLDKSRIQLELLMLEGDLMELDLEESSVIWNVLRNSEANAESSAVEPDELDVRVEAEASQENKCKELERFRDKQRRMKRKADDDKSRRRGGKPKRAKKPARPVNQEVSNDKSAAEGEEEEEDEDCSAMPCLRPTGCEVTWVQCDGACELWFHLHCVGLDRGDISEQEDYICSQCNGPNPEQRMQIIGAMDTTIPLAHEPSLLATPPHSRNPT
ncbi:lysine-specific demethylase lid isoform X1 [Frankliniella occidentalis]|uniref:[histone H3]-trimethyl-L-lysine(4) demethylase n=2 Tax=Frankliniella occidentalis TaxID=133901 RepID=A0A6J1RTK8_FRAOC|nr:lysine-specific demethylase lid isoform X1 [Frankliniella occidentalis]